MFKGYALVRVPSILFTSRKMTSGQVAKDHSLWSSQFQRSKSAATACTWPKSAEFFPVQNCFWIYLITARETSLAWKLACRNASVGLIVTWTRVIHGVFFFATHIPIWQMRFTCIGSSMHLGPGQGWFSLLKKKDSRHKESQSRGCVALQRLWVHTKYASQRPETAFKVEGWFLVVCW